ncbi:MAG: hypothetical protein AB8F34_01855 [Akkermansiaceae bacterium]
MDTENNQETNQDAQAKRHFESCADAFRAGKEDAAAKAQEAAPKLKSAIADVIFDVAYGATYGAVFASAFANEFVPQAVKEGVAKGAAAGKDAADKVRAKMNKQSEVPDSDETIELPAPA